jgi:hypothetical protein
MLHVTRHYFPQLLLSLLDQNRFRGCWPRVRTVIPSPPSPPFLHPMSPSLRAYMRGHTQFESVFSDNQQQQQQQQQNALNDLECLTSPLAAAGALTLHSSFSERLSPHQYKSASLSFFTSILQLILQFHFSLVTTIPAALSIHHYLRESRTVLIPHLEQSELVLCWHTWLHHHPRRLPRHRPRRCQRIIDSTPYHNYPNSNATILPSYAAFPQSTFNLLSLFLN